MNKVPGVDSHAHEADRSWVLWVIVAAIGVHVIEEYALNFTGWSARALSVPVSWQDFHLVNAGVTTFAVACAIVGWRLPSFSLTSAALVLLNAALFHGGSSILLGQYSPGTSTAVLLFGPAGVYAYLAAARDGVLSRRVFLLSAGGGLLWHAFLGGVFYVKYFAPLYP